MQYEFSPAYWHFIYGIRVRYIRYVTFTDIRIEPSLDITEARHGQEPFTAFHTASHMAQGKAEHSKDQSRAISSSVTGASSQASAMSPNPAPSSTAHCPARHPACAASPPNYPSITSEGGGAGAEHRVAASLRASAWPD
eukprot:184324-Chlamydomonas_euryale.AAC.1